MHAAAAVLPIATTFRYNYRALMANIRGIHHRDSIAPLAADLNDINWVVGHIVISRDRVLRVLGLPPVCDEAMPAMYGGQAPAPGDQRRDLGTLLMLFEGGQEMILDGLANAGGPLADPDRLNELAGLAFHEAYHVGQLGLLRKLAGKEGAIK